MSKKANLELIDHAQISSLIQFSEPRVYNAETELIYQGHVPHAGFLLIEGTIRFLKNKKVIHEVETGGLFGVIELMGHKPFPYTAVITPGSKVAILDRSTILELKDVAAELSRLPMALASY
jgi:CRP-like cAMP-binding protein